jgi:hypothetical protein
MNINLDPANGILAVQTEIERIRRPAGAKALPHFAAFAARLKSCPDTRPAQAQEFKDAGAMLIFILF